jgi:hypothetical protein
MAGHSRSKNGVASLAYVPAISIFETLCPHYRDARHKAGHDDGAVATIGFIKFYREHGGTSL